MMLVGYVSDERYVAIADVLLEFENDCSSTVVRSTPRGAIYADIQPGPYRVTLAKEGFGGKTVHVTVTPDAPYQFRLLADGLLGYAWPKWVKAGQKADVRIHSAQPYRLSLWRYGENKQEVRLLGWFAEHGPSAIMQTTPDGDYTRSGAGWNREGYAAYPFARPVTAPEQSGLYYFHVEDDAGGFFSFPWVVAPATPQASIAVLASTNTWNAYNNFGGRSNYISPAGLPSQPTVNARQDLPRYTKSSPTLEWSYSDDEFAPLSFERPEAGNSIPASSKATDPIRGRVEAGLAPGEWRLYAWLESQGYTYDLYADHQLHCGHLDLDAYAILIISVHPEYWSREMYQKVKEWVQERKGKLMYLGGNGINCEIEFPDDAAMRCKSHLVSIDGSLGMTDPADPERYLESRFHRTFESEANLLGVVTTDSGIMTAAPYRIIDESHWVFEGTGLKNGELFGWESLHECVPGGASGHETDKRSPSSPPEVTLLAKGTNEQEGGAEMVTYMTGSGGAVFSAGSITWVSSLLVEESVSRITANVIERFLVSES